MGWGGVGNQRLVYEELPSTLLIFLTTCMGWGGVGFERVVYDELLTCNYCVIFSNWNNVVGFCNTNCNYIVICLFKLQLPKYIHKKHVE